MSKALSHLRVLDLSRVLAGPWAGQILADLGAEVIKVERPGTGDDTRGWGPPFLKDAGGQESTEAAYYLCANRAKKSIAIDLSTDQGQELVRGLVRDSDVVIENFKVGGLAKYGLDYESLRAVNPGIVYCSITGFGQTGPYAAQAGYDFIVQGLSGLMSITGEPDGQPQKVGTAVADLTTGMYAVIGILAALAHRDRTGQGQHIDMALLDTCIGWLANQNTNYLIGNVVPIRRGNTHPNIVPYQAFETADGHIIVAAGNDRQFARFATAIGRGDLAEHRDYKTNQGRVRHRERLVPELEAAIKTKPTADWLAILEEVNIPHGPINTIEQAFQDRQVQHRALEVELDHPLGVKVPTVACPIKLSETPVEYRDPPPMLGQHTDEILQSLGIDQERIDTLRKSGVVQ